MSITSDSTATGAASGAASGAALGTMVMPGFGTAAGAIVGGVAGGVMGFMGGKKAKKAKAARRAEKQRQEQAVRVEQQRRDTNVGRVRESFGILGTADEMAKNPEQGKRTLAGRVAFGSMIDQTNANVTEGNLAALTDNTEAAMNTARSAASARGLTGGSLDQNNKANVIGQYFAGRAEIGASAESGREDAMRTSARQAQSAEAAVKAGGEVPTGIGDAGNRALATLREGRSNIGSVAFGNMLNRSAQPLANAVMMDARPREREAAERRYGFGTAIGADTVKGS